MPTTVLVFLLFPTLLGLIKKRAPPYPHGIAIPDIYNSYSPYISSKVSPCTAIFQTRGPYVLQALHALAFIQMPPKWQG
jgi:hypothetical protein